MSKLNFVAFLKPFDLLESWGKKARKRQHTTKQRYSWSHVPYTFNIKHLHCHETFCLLHSVPLWAEIEISVCRTEV